MLEQIMSALEKVFQYILGFIVLVGYYVLKCVWFVIKPIHGFLTGIFGSFFGTICTFSVIIFILVYVNASIRDSEYGKKRQKKAEEKRYQEKQKVGDDYERLVAKNIGNRLGETVYRNVLIDKGRGKTEADMIFINNKGVFCVECKYRTDEPQLSGNVADDTFRMNYYNSGSGEFDNPAKQNRGHINALAEKLNIHPGNIYNVVVTNMPFELQTYKNIYKSSKTPCFLYKPLNTFYVRDKESGKGSKALDKEIQQMDTVFTAEEVELYKNTVNGMVATEDEMARFKERMRESSY